MMAMGRGAEILLDLVTAPRPSVAGRAVGRGFRRGGKEGEDADEELDGSGDSREQFEDDN